MEKHGNKYIYLNIKKKSKASQKMSDHKRDIFLLIHQKNYPHKLNKQKIRA